jgi:hypothetical protein
LPAINNQRKKKATRSNLQPTPNSQAYSPHPTAKPTAHNQQPTAYSPHPTAKPTAHTQQPSLQPTPNS